MNDNVLCTGSLIVDIFNIPVKKALGPNEGVDTKIFVHPGGNAFNVSKDLVNLRFPGRQITCLGPVGEDVFKGLFLDELNSLNITADLYTVPEGNTSKIFMLKVENEEPRYYYDEGANAYLSADYIISRVKELKPNSFYTGETGNTKSLLPVFPELMKTAKSEGCLTLVDTVVPPGNDWRFLFQSASYIDIVKCNEYEAESATNVKDMKAALRRLAETGIPLIIISCADKGVLFSYNGTHYKMPAFNVPCKDPLGAGDAFNAGIIKTISGWKGKTISGRLGKNNKNLVTAIVYASACGAAAVTEYGCFDGVSEDNVSRLVCEQGERIAAGIGEV